MSSYNYVKEVNIDRLSKEIDFSVLITVKRQSIVLVGSALTVTFLSSLPAAEKTALDDIVAAHVNEPLPSEVQLVDTSIQKDIENATITRLKYAPSGWTYQAHCFEIKTSTVGGFVSRDSDGTQIPFGVLKFYRADGTEITTGQTDIDAECVLTRLIWTPDHSLEVICGSVTNFTAVTEDVRLYAIVAPHIPHSLGGSKKFIQGGLNLKFANPGVPLRTDGRSSKHIAYDSVNYSHRWHFDIKHPVGHKHEFQLILEFYKE